MIPELEALRDALRAVPGVASSKIGLEANISPIDYPMVRLVPTRFVPGKPFGIRSAETLIYFGSALTNSQGLEAVYTELFELEASILWVLQDAGVKYVETITDEDRLDAYKLMTVRCEVPCALWLRRSFTAAGTLASRAAAIAGAGEEVPL